MASVVNDDRVVYRFEAEQLYPDFIELAFGYIEH